jgi:hypothetical protein
MTTYPGSGILTQFYGPLAEATYGVAPTLTGAHFYAIKGGGSLKGKKATAQGEGLFSGALYPQASRRVLAGWDPAGGSVPLELPTRNLQQWLLPMFGSYGQTLATLTEDSSTGAYKSVHAPGPLQSHSFVVQKGVATVDGTIEPFTYTGCKISDWELSVAKHGIAELTHTIVARNELAATGNSDPLNGSVPSLVSYSKPIGSVFHWAQATLYTGGTASTTSGLTSLSSPTTAGNIKSISIKHTVPLDVDRYFLGQGGFMSEPVDNGLRTITVSFEVEWLSAMAYQEAWYGDTATAIKLDLVGPGIGSGSDDSMFEVLIPEMFFDGEPSPVVAGTQVVTQKIDLAGLDDGTNNVIQGTYWTLDAT